MKKFLFALLASASLTGIAQSEVMTPEKLWELGRVSLDAVSEDGEQILYGLSTYNLNENKGSRSLYLLPSKGGEARLLLSDFEGSQYQGQFVGERIGFSSQGQFYLVDQDGQNLEVITDIEGGLNGVKAYPMTDGSIKLLFGKSVKVRQTPAERYPDLPQAEFRIIDDLMYRHWNRWDDYNASHLCLAQYLGTEPVSDYQDLMEGEPYSCPVPPFGGAESYTMNPKGTLVVYESKKISGKDFAESTNSELYLVDLRTMETKVISEGLRGYDKQPQFSPNGKQLAWLSMATDGYESDVNDLVVMNLESGKRKHALKGKSLYDQYTFQSFQWEEEDEFYVGVPYQGSNQIFELEFDGDEVELEKVSQGDHNYNHFELAGEDLIVARQDINHATEIYRLSEDGDVQQLTTVNDPIYQSIAMGKIEKRMIKTSEGEDMLTWVMYPPNFDPAKKYPTLLYCQGGPQGQVSQFYSFRWNFQLMAAQGYIVVAPNRHGLPGFGREWNEQISGDWGGQAMKDYLAAIDEVAKEPFVDKENLGAVGASYGGYSVYLLAGIHEGRFNAFISHCGLFDLESWYLTTEEMFFANYDLGGPFWEEENKEDYARFDPKDYIQNWDTPILVIHGGKDFRVPENQGMEAFNAAKLRGVEARFLYFPNEGHWILSPQNGLVWHDQFFGWLDDHLKK